MKKIILSLFTTVLFLTACSSDQKKVVIYSPHADPLLESVADRFEEETGIRVEFLNMGTDTMVERARSEKSKPSADILYGGSASYFAELKKEGLLVQSTPSWAKEIDSSFVDPDGYWFGPMQTPAILYYNTNNIKPVDVPADWADLTNAKYEDKLIWLGTGGTINIFTTVMGMNNSAAGGEEGAKEWFKLLDKNVKEYHQIAGISYQAMNSPAGGIGMFVLPYIADGIYNFNYPWAIVPTKSGVINIIDSVAIVANSPNSEEAKLFLEWVGSPENQAILAQEFNRMPTHPEAIENSPQWMKEFKLASMKVDWEKVALELPKWVKAFEEIRSK